MNSSSKGGGLGRHLRVTRSQTSWARGGHTTCILHQLHIALPPSRFTLGPCDIALLLLLLKYPAAAVAAGQPLAGDVRCVSDARALMAATGADGVMSAEPLLFNPIMFDPQQPHDVSNWSHPPTEWLRGEPCSLAGQRSCFAVVFCAGASEHLLCTPRAVPRNQLAMIAAQAALASWPMLLLHRFQGSPSGAWLWAAEQTQWSFHEAAVADAAPPLTYHQKS